MLVRRSSEVEAQSMSMAGASGVSMRLLVGRGDAAPHFAMRQFTVDPGGHTPEHHHPYEHEVYVLSGKGVVRGGRTVREIRAGDVVFMPADELHQFKATGAEPLVFLCMVPVTHDCGNGCAPTPGA